MPLAILNTLINFSDINITTTTAVPLLPALNYKNIDRAGLSTRLTRLQPRAPNFRGPKRVMRVRLSWTHVSVAKWANTLSVPQYLLGLTG